MNHSKTNLIEFEKVNRRIAAESILIIDLTELITLIMCFDVKVKKR